MPNNINSPESFGLKPGDAGYDDFDKNFPLGDERTAAPVDFQDTPPEGIKAIVTGYDNIVGEAWRLKGQDKITEARELLERNGIQPED